MGRRRGTLAVLAVVVLSGCIPRINGQGGSGVSLALGGRGPRPTPVSAVQRQLSAAERRVRDLETQLAERDRQIAAVRSEMQAVQAGRPPASSPADAAPPAPAPRPAGDTAAAEPLPAAAAEAPGAGDDETRLAEAQREIASLQARLDVEVQRRAEVESEMARLLQETSAGPFDRADDTVVKHLQQELNGARQEIATLRTTLATERRQRGDLERRYAALQARAQRTDAAGDDSEEISALKARQRRVLASIQQDLEGARQRERELRETLARQRGDDAVSLADAVSGLRTENSALQRRLDEEHRRNRDLQAKLQTATRVTDLIFKMQSSGSAPATVAP